MLHHPEVKTRLEPLSHSSHLALVTELDHVFDHELHVEEEQDDEAVLILVLLIEVVVLPAKDEEEKAVVEEVAQEEIQCFVYVFVPLICIYGQLFG